MSFADNIELFINNNKNNILIYTESTADVIQSVQSVCREKNIKTSVIYAGECDVINNEQLSAFNMTSKDFNIVALTATNPDTLYIINEAQHLNIDMEELFKGAYPVIIITSDRHLLADFKKYPDNLLIDDGNNFYEYMKLENLSIMEQLYLYIITDRKLKYIGIYKNISDFPNESSISRIFKYTYSILSKYFLYNKPIRDIYTYFKAPELYVSVMYALANGCCNSGDIANKINIKQTTVSKYLGELKRLGYIKYITPITNPKSNNGRFVINSPYYHFWFRFLYKNLYVCNDKSKAESDIKDNHETFIKENYIGEYCKYWIRKNLSTDNIIWNEWRNVEYQFDMLGVCEDKKSIYLVKYFDKTVNYKDYEKMKTAASELEIYDKYQKIYTIFSFKGFDDEIRNLSKSDKNIRTEKVDLGTTNAHYMINVRHTNGL